MEAVVKANECKSTYFANSSILSFWYLKAAKIFDRFCSRVELSLNKTDDNRYFQHYRSQNVSYIGWNLETLVCVTIFIVVFECCYMYGITRNRLFKRYFWRTFQLTSDWPRAMIGYICLERLIIALADHIAPLSPTISLSPFLSLNFLGNFAGLLWKFTLWRRCALAYVCVCVGQFER